ncbi:alpha/beta fold hydrolase [Sphingomicrobium astaxanthinifaciens]|uniref:alpha/beta fold hydrolase n=1 Tax=Sphingomicrobium astaxanthinifaciens TaxID=1227949 RepID=UPI001FCBCBD2|nr:alpha/beta hydrolase [Sphingomicrobium astaxanthinifaciens]MCJ7421381.1 alpha/beta hydrolase [Sphingomicrobium astaxanthinifaciens]
MKTQRISLSTGIGLDVALAGPEDAPPVFLLHGFPESHRTWRGIVPLLEDRFRLIMPDQRGFGGSDKPRDLDDYRTDKAIADLLALAAALGHQKFSLVGHDWGGAVAWAAALRGGPHIEKLAIVNSPHPLLFQKSLIDDPAQRAASQYMRAFRATGMEEQIRAMGWDTFFDKSFCPHLDLATIPDADRQAYLEEWSAEGALEGMLAWYRASPILVPAMDEEDVPYPDWVMSGVPRIRIPTLVVWGMKDPALLPCQLDGLGELVDDLRIERVADAGHFVPWEKPEPVAKALADFLG